MQFNEDRKLSILHYDFGNNNSNFILSSIIENDTGQYNQELKKQYSSVVGLKYRVSNEIYNGRKQTFEVFNRNIAKQIDPIKITKNNILTNHQSANKLLKKLREANDEDASRIQPGLIYFTDFWTNHYQQTVLLKSELEKIRNDLKKDKQNKIIVGTKKKILDLNQKYRTWDKRQLDKYQLANGVGNMLKYHKDESEAKFKKKQLQIQINR